MSSWIKVLAAFGLASTLTLNAAFAAPIVPVHGATPAVAHNNPKAHAMKHHKHKKHKKHPRHDKRPTSTTLKPASFKTHSRTMV